jgi:hypothetical protein
VNEIKTLDELGAICAKVQENSKPSKWSIVDYTISPELRAQLTCDANGTIKVTFKGIDYSVRKSRGSKAAYISTLTVGTCLMDHTNPVTNTEWKTGNMFYSWN